MKNIKESEVDELPPKPQPMPKPQPTPKPGEKPHPKKKKIT